MIEVRLRVIFDQRFPRFPKTDQDKIAKFILHIKQYGFTGLPGRNKASHEVDRDDTNFVSKVQYAIQHKLWHYHIGIPKYTGSSGDQTSEWIIHYQLIDNIVYLVDLDYHPPFNLPSEDYLE